MIFGVPAIDGDVDAAAESQRVVDDDQFLMMGAPNGQRIVQGDDHPGRRAPIQIHGGQRLSLEGVEDRVIPQEQSYDQVVTTPDQIFQKLPEFRRAIIVRGSIGSNQPRAAVNIPSRDDHRLTGLKQSRSESPEIAGTVQE
jgi:hypothetical protein